MYTEQHDKGTRYMPTYGDILLMSLQLSLYASVWHFLCMVLAIKTIELLHQVQHHLRYWAYH